ncbi:MAG: hypothetical protein HeimC3_25060 [Candidatus Heimdallarchaeota archaeon LC_3]|nr:MAG: hypothetical protein HeimC3_25060 [Candidatus Heimdallarchaeota archaeon LC_3]
MIDTTLEPIYSIIPIGASMISLIISITLIKSYISRKELSFGLWAVSFLFFFIATFLEGISPLIEWSDITYRLYYVSAILLVFFLGGGQLFYMISHEIIFKEIHGRIYLIYGAIIISFVIIFAIISTVDVNKLVGVIPGGIGWGEEYSLERRSIIRIFSPLLTIPGSLLIIGGTLGSYYLDRKPFILLITVGAILLAGAGAVTSIFGITVVQFFVELIGIIFIYLGFRKSS